MPNGKNWQRFDIHERCKLVTGKSLDSPEKQNVEKMSKKCPKNVQKLSETPAETNFGHLGDIFAYLVSASIW